MEEGGILFGPSGPCCEGHECDTANIGCQESCHEIFRRWLDGQGCQPITWEKLIEALKDAEKSCLAEQLQDFLANMV